MNESMEHEDFKGTPHIVLQRYAPSDCSMGLEGVRCTRRRRYRVIWCELVKHPLSVMDRFHMGSADTALLPHG